MSLSQRTEMRRCGKSWPAEDAARCSKRYLAALDGGQEPAVTPCALGCGGWHVVLPKDAPGETAAPARIEGFPAPVRAAALARDLACIGCGYDGALDVHHRRIRGHGGDSRPHTHCLCNAVCLCRAEHRAAHLAGRREAEGAGWVISREVLLPGSVSVMLFGSGGGGASMFPTCDGRWSETAEVIAA